MTPTSSVLEKLTITVNDNNLMASPADDPVPSGFTLTIQNVPPAPKPPSPAAKDMDAFPYKLTQWELNLNRIYIWFPPEQPNTVAITTPELLAGITCTVSDGWLARSFFHAEKGRYWILFPVKPVSNVIVTFGGILIPEKNTGKTTQVAVEPQLYDNGTYHQDIRHLNLTIHAEPFDLTYFKFKEFPNPITQQPSPPSPFPLTLQWKGRRIGSHFLKIQAETGDFTITIEEYPDRFLLRSLLGDESIHIPVTKPDAEKGAKFLNIGQFKAHGHDYEFQYNMKTNTTFTLTVAEEKNLNNQRTEPVLTAAPYEPFAVSKFEFKGYEGKENVVIESPKEGDQKVNVIWEVSRASSVRIDTPIEGNKTIDPKGSLSEYIRENKSGYTLTAQDKLSNRVIRKAISIIPSETIVRYDSRIHIKSSENDYFGTATKPWLGVYQPHASNSKATLIFARQPGTGFVPTSLFPGLLKDGATICIRSQENDLGNDNYLYQPGTGAVCYYGHDDKTADRYAWQLRKVTKGDGFIRYGDAFYIESVAYERCRLAKRGDLFVALKDNSTSWKIEKA